MRSIRIGVGSGFSGDRIAPALELVQYGQLEYLVFECLAERTIALAQLQRLENSESGYDIHLEKRFNAVLIECVKNKVKIITNMGAGNPVSAAKKTVEIAHNLGIKNIKIVAVTGDDITAYTPRQDIQKISLDGVYADVGALGDSFISANAYTGTQGICQALNQGADIIICGRVADPVLFLAPMIYEFHWDIHDYNILGQGTVIGHLLECAAQISGGYFADYNKKIVPNLAQLGYPIAEIYPDGTAHITKVANTGGIINRQTAIEQLLYEVHDPKRYYQPDVIANFSTVNIDEIAPDCVRISGGSGIAPTGKYKVSVGYKNGWVGEGHISYAGYNCLQRATHAGDILHQRLTDVWHRIHDHRIDILGINSIVNAPIADAPPMCEVRLRYVAHCMDAQTARRVIHEVDSLYISGPAGGGGVQTHIRPLVSIASGYVKAHTVQSHLRSFKV